MTSDKDHFRLFVELAVVVAVLLAGLASCPLLLNHFTKKSAIEHGGYVECAGMPHPHDVEACSGLACETAAAVCDPELFRVLREKAQ